MNDLDYTEQRASENIQSIKESILILKEEIQKLLQVNAELKEENQHFRQMHLPDQSAARLHIQECIEEAIAVERQRWVRICDEEKAKYSSISPSASGVAIKIKRRGMEEEKDA